MIDLIVSAAIGSIAGFVVAQAFGLEQYCEDGNAPLMPDGAQDALNALREEVQRYIDGKRAQGDLFNPANLSGPCPVKEGGDLNDEIERDLHRREKQNELHKSLMKKAKELLRDGTTIEVVTR